MYQNLQGVVPYPTMSWEELADMPVGKLADPKMCALFLWATGPLIHRNIALMEHWGFEYKCVYKVWRKTNADGTPVCSPGWWSRSSCEFLLVGTKGSNILKFKTTNSERQEYASVREGHSAKPAAITQSVADFLAVPGPRIELWARESHPLFDSWGRLTLLQDHNFLAHLLDHECQQQQCAREPHSPSKVKHCKPVHSHERLKLIVA